MADLYFSEQGSSLHKYGESLHLKKQGKLLFEIEFKNIETIQIFGNIQFSTQVLRKLFEYGIELALYSSTGRLLGQLTPTNLKNIDLRFKQNLHYQDANFRLAFAKRILEAKISLAQHFLGRISRRKKSASPDPRPDMAIKLAGFMPKLETSQSLESLLGLEGSFSRAYYEIFASLFRHSGLFHGRSKRPPKDAANALMSFLYTLVTNKLGAMLDGCGLDPYLGYYHGLEYGRMSLACDLVEIFRANLCDRLALRSFNLGIFSDQDFEERDGGIYFKRSELKRLFQYYHEQGAKRRDFVFIQGNLDQAMAHLVHWVKQSIQNGQVPRIMG